MLYNLTKKLEQRGYLYKLINLHCLEVWFEKVTIRFTILDNYYRVYVFNLDNKIIAHKDYKYVNSAINYMLKF